MRRRFKWVSLALVAAMVIGVIAYDGYASKSGAANRTTSSINLNVDHEISVLSQNLRVGSQKDGEDNTVKLRNKRLKKELNNYNTDIRCFQECTKEWKNNLDRKMVGLFYYQVYEYNNKGLCNPIYVKKSRFDVLDSGSFQLSERTSAKSDESRVASWMKLKDKKTDKTLLMLNAHLGLELKIQEDSCNKIMAFVKASDTDGYLMCGDFNFSMDTNNAAYKIMLTNNTKDMAIAAKTEGMQGITGGTFHDYGRKESPKRIDFFFGSSNLKSKMYSLINDTYDGLYMSDHYGLLNYIDISVVADKKVKEAEITGSNNDSHNTTDNNVVSDNEQVVDNVEPSDEEQITAEQIPIVDNETPLDNNGFDVVDSTVNNETSSCEVKVLSQNLRIYSANDGWGNSLKKRYTRIREIVEKYNADINCFQECSIQWKPYTDTMLPSSVYTCVFKKTNVGHCNPVYIRKCKFDVVETGSFELSSADSDTSYGENRMASWAIVKDKTTGKKLLMINGHLTTVAAVQASSCTKIMDFVKSKNVENYLMCGDFNFTSTGNKEAYNIMRSNNTKDMAIAAKTEGIQGATGGTFHNYGKRENPIRIDFFFGASSLISKEYTMITDTFNGMYASDHYGIYNRVEIK